MEPGSGIIVITLEKVIKTWWSNLLLNHPKIDCTKVDSTMNVSEYDEATQAAIRKIMFDQKQGRLGLPSSDEILGIRKEEELDMRELPPMPGQEEMGGER